MGIEPERLVLRPLGLADATHPENVALQRVLEKTGFRFERPADYDGTTIRLYAVGPGGAEIALP